MITIHNANTSFSQLKQVELKTPERAGSVWKGIPHYDLVATMRRQLRKRKISVNNMKFSLSKGGSNCVGAFDLDVPDIETPEGITHSIGFLNYNDMRKPLELVSGATVKICHNGLVIGTQILRKKHTSHFPLSTAIDGAITQYLTEITDLGSVVQSMKDKTVSTNKACRLMMDAGKLGLIPWTRIKDVHQEFTEPSHTEHGKGTAWTLMNAFTAISKQSPAHRQMYEMNQIRELILAA